MEEETTLAEATDQFVEIRERYEQGVELTDADIDTIADIAVGHVRRLLSFFGEDNITIDEYEGDDGVTTHSEGEDPTRHVVVTALRA